MVAAYGTSDVTAVVTWNPLVAEIVAMPGANKVFDSTKIPGEIIDMMVVNTETLKENPALGKALVGAWYEVMALMNSGTPAGQTAKEEMAKTSGTDLAGFDAQLASTAMFYEAGKAVDFTKGPELPKTMDLVRNFLFDHGILGTNATSVDMVGMSFADGSTLGDANNVKLRFDPAFMVEAAAGSL